MGGILIVSDRMIIATYSLITYGNWQSMTVMNYI